MFKKITLLLNTLRNLKFIQISYRVFYSIVRRKYKQYQFKDKVEKIRLLPHISNKISIEGTKFTFLNQAIDFKNQIDWNFNENGKLWTYNLNYFDFLLQKDISKEQGVELIHNYVQQINRNNILDGLEPYPISLRGINWIKFLSKYYIDIPEFHSSLYSQYQLLTRSIEFHILGNHLLENGFSLLFAAYYFRDKRFLHLAKKILYKELSEQILSDGGHFELSPMYHRIILNRVLDCINLVNNNRTFSEPNLAKLLISKSEIMISWLINISFNNGSQPNFNDSLSCIYASKEELLNYSKSLDLETNTNIPLSESGYRKIKGLNFELFVDIGNIGPSYQPGHAHSDTFNFELSISGKPFIVDTGISTYEKNNTRQMERSTLAHNTVVVDGMEQSEVWGGFRVGRQAKVILTKEIDNFISGTHNGYNKIRLLHNRSYSWNNDIIEISDILKSKESTLDKYALLHFHPEVEIRFDSENQIVYTNLANISFKNAERIEELKYNFAEDYNLTINASCLRIFFSNALTTFIKIKK